MQAGVQQVEFARSVIRSNKRLTYAWHASKNDDPDAVCKHPPAQAPDRLHRPSPDRQRRGTRDIAAAHPLAVENRQPAAQKRFRNGSLDLEAVKLYVDEAGYADCIEKQSHDESHQLIEEFMLAATQPWPAS